MALTIKQGRNPYRDNVQGKANEPITVASLLDRAARFLRVSGMDHNLEAVYGRLEDNAPRIAIVAGSPDHPAHIMDAETVHRAAVRIWQRGGVPFQFNIPVICDATAQSNIGMSYSLQSRNMVAEMVVSQMEAHSYHGAYVIAGCDKTPLGIVAGLAHLDRIRQRRGDAPVVATFHPCHVLRGGTIPPDLMTNLEAVARRAEARGHPGIASELREGMRCILLCITNAAFQSVLTRARHRGIISATEQKAYERRLAVSTCDRKGGVCAFNGTGNSSRHVVAALGLAHPSVEFLTEPPTTEQVNRVVDDLFKFVDRPEFSVGNMVAANFANSVRVHSAMGGSSNLMLHMVAAMIYAGYDVSVSTMDRIRRDPPVPDIFDYSLTGRRDIFALAQQCNSGAIRGMETVFYELIRQGIPIDVDAPTVTGQTWQQRLGDTANLGASGVPDNPIILSTPRRPFSGVDILRSNVFEAAVVKISGMTSEQVAHVDGRVGVALFFESEEDANAGLLDVHLLDRLKRHTSLTQQKLSAMAHHNRRRSHSDPAALQSLDREALFDRMVKDELLRVVIVISGQGPEAFGMPEMFAPMQHINANRVLRRLTVLMSDGRFSGTSYGAAIGHVVPEALVGGTIGLLETGDLVHIQLTNRRVDLLDPGAFVEGHLAPWSVDLRELRRSLGAERRRRILERRRKVAVTNWMSNVTDACRGVVPLVIAEGATKAYPLNSSLD